MFAGVKGHDPSAPKETKPKKDPSALTKKERNEYIQNTTDHTDSQRITLQALISREKATVIHKNHPQIADRSRNKYIGIRIFDREAVFRDNIHSAPLLGLASIKISDRTLNARTRIHIHICTHTCMHS